MAAGTAGEIGRLVRLIDEAHARRSWHGTNLRGALRGLTAAQAGRRCGRAQRCIADIVVHCAYWKYTVRRRLRGHKRGSFALPGSNWFRLPAPLTETAWRGYQCLLQAEHDALRAAVADLTPAALAGAPAGSKTSTLMLLHGVALHDVYHTGQIQFMKGLLRV